MARDSAVFPILLLFAFGVLPQPGADGAVYPARLGRGSLQLELAATPDAR
jgi:hypothetical protein